MKSKRKGTSSHHNSSQNTSKSKKHSTPADENDNSTSNCMRTPIEALLGPQNPLFAPNLDDESEWKSVPAMDVLDRLAPPVLFFPTEVIEEYVARFCERQDLMKSPNGLAKEGFPDREVPVMRRLITMMAGILSKAAESASKSCMSSCRPRNPLFQQNMNASVFTLFSTLSASANQSRRRNEVFSSNNLPPPPFFAKDGQPQYGYSARLLRFWQSLSTQERTRLVREEHTAMTTAWQDYAASKSNEGWCLCAHCKHRRMTVNDLTDAVYSAYCDELAEYLRTGSKLYTPNSNTPGEASNEAATRAKKFLFRALSVVGEQAILPRYNQFILRLESFSTAALSDQHPEDKSLNKLEKAYVSSFRQTVKQKLKERGFEGEVVKMQRGGETPKIGSITPSPVLKASQEFLQTVKKQQKQQCLSNESESDESDNEDEEINGWAQAEFEGMGPYSWKRDFLFDAEYLRKLACLSRGPQYMRDRYGDEADVLFGSDSEGEDGEPGDGSNRGPRGAIMSEDDEELIDAETDLPIDEAELVLPGGAACPLLPPGESEGVAQWSEASRIECGRTVFLMFASEMFQYRLSAAYLDSLAKEKQLELLREVEEEERRERAELEKRLAAEKKAKEAKKKKKKAPPVKSSKTTKEPIKAQKKEESSEAESSEAESERVDSLVVEEEESTFTNVDESAIELASKQPPINPINQITSDSAYNTVTPAESDDDDDFDPLSLIDELSKEMNRFELSRTEDPSSTTAASAQPLKMDDAPPGFAPIKSNPNYERPPFSFQLDDGPPGMLFPHAPPPPPPPMHSRFSSFFSNSVFGPSTSFFTPR